MIPERIERLRAIIAEHNLDAMLIVNPENRYYLSGFTGTSGALLINLNKAYLLTDFRYAVQAKEQAADYEIILFRDHYYEAINDLISSEGWEKIGIESRHLSCHNLDILKEKLPAQLIQVEESVEKLRRVKSTDEIEQLREGAKKLDLAYKWLLEEIKPGRIERELAVELEIFLLRQGAERTSFTFIVASGLRGSMPHGVASEKAIGQGELVTIDFGSVFNKYATDMTRTVAIGAVDERLKEIYDIVRHAQEKGFQSIKPGITAKDADSAARVIIEEAGYGEFFGHGLGHGIGLETHEQPALNKKNEAVLEPGMVITVEPGIYIPDFGGVRIEDMVLVTETGAERLTESTRELIII
ncbi:MAG: M24 family metallopeptidase [Dethiobacteria bacterium]